MRPTGLSEGQLRNFISILGAISGVTPAVRTNTSGPHSGDPTHALPGDMTKVLHVCRFEEFLGWVLIHDPCFNDSGIFQTPT